jgi:hypothetical protein
MPSEVVKIMTEDFGNPRGKEKKRGNLANNLIPRSMKLLGDMKGIRLR